MTLNYQIISNNLLKELPQRHRNILRKRFGFDNKEKLTLESIGKEYELTRERVRQIEQDGLNQLRKKININNSPFSYFWEEIHSNGNIKRETSLVSSLGEEKFENQILFLLSLDSRLEKFRETEEFYSFWAIGKEPIILVRQTISSFAKELEKKNKPLTLKQYLSPFPEKTLFSYLEVSKKILRTSSGFYGLSNWPEINPKGVKDKAYLTLKKENKPLHFSVVSEAIKEGGNIQTVHNELIKDPRFILVGRGTYALSEWGYKSGVVKDVISDIIKESKKPLAQNDILKGVLEQRMVKENTILLNLNNKKYFLKDSQGKYKIREA